MPDGPFKSMTPDPTSRKVTSDQPAYRCKGCDGWIYIGDWPHCGGSPASHKR